MRLVKDLVLFDLETTGDDIEKDSVIQLAAIVLDKDNLLEKGVYNTYIRTSLLEGTLSQHAKLLGIPFELLRKSPKVLEAVKPFAELFDSSVILASQNSKRIFFLKNLFKKAALPYPYDFHVFDLWTLEYTFIQKLGLKKVPTLNTLIDYFNLKIKNPHHALERARLEAEILRRIIK